MKLSTYLLAILSLVFVSFSAKSSDTFIISLVQGNDIDPTIFEGESNGGNNPSTVPFQIFDPDTGQFGALMQSTLGTSLLYDPTGIVQIGQSDEPGGFLTPITFGDNLTSSTTSTFSLTGFDVFAITIVAGNQFLLLDSTHGSPIPNGPICTDGSCDVLGITLPALEVGNNGSNPAFSHVTLFGRESVSTVPEPATWLMMIIGFAGIGLTLRYRRSIMI